MSLNPSLLVGSSTLGWREFADAAQLGAMTRAMPGGDGSLSFTLPGSVAEQRRNQLVAGATAILRQPGDTWAGLIVGDPLNAYARALPTVALAAAGLWAHAAYRRDLSYVWADSDPTQWFRIRQEYDSTDPDLMVDFVDQGKFSVDTEGRLYIRADADRTFSGYARCKLAYWLDQGLVDTGCRIVGLDLIYESNFPTDWRMTVRSMDGTPWDCSKSGTMEATDTTSRTSWRTLQLDLTQASTSLNISLNYNNYSSGSPSTNPWIKIKSVKVYCRGSVGSVDRAIRIDEAMADLAQLTGFATTTRTETTTTGRTHLAFRPDAERSLADMLRELAAMHDSPLEYYFDYASGAWRWTQNALPSSVDPARNRHWVLSDRRAGESSEEVQRDYETAPEYVRVYYLSSGVADVPDGFPRTYCYPSEPTSFRSHVHAETTHADGKLTDTEAADIAERLYEQFGVAAFSGSARFPQTALTTAGQELPAYLIRPGDRVNIPGRGATDIYVRETSWDFAQQKMTAGLGLPFDKLPPAAVARAGTTDALFKTAGKLNLG